MASSTQSLSQVAEHFRSDRYAEAKALLQYTNWSVADIAYGLGFDYPTYFNNFFKRITGRNPKSFRVSEV